MANLSNINNKFLVTTGGDVGINTTSPDARLHVNGTTFLEGTFGNPNTDAAYRIKFYDNGGVYNDAGIGLDGSGGGSEKMWFNAYSGFYWNEGTKGIKMMLDGTGRLGIGTDLPSSLLTLNATSGGALQWQYNGGNYLRIEADSGGGSYYAAAGFYHRFFTSGLERMRITGGGNVLMGNGSQANNSDCNLTLRDTQFVGLDFKSSRTVGNIGGTRYYGTASDSVPVAQFLIEVDGSYNFYNGTNGAQNIMQIKDNGQVNISQKPNSGLEYDLLINLGTSPDGLVGYQTREQFNNATLQKWYNVDAANSGSSQWVRLGTISNFGQGGYTFCLTFYGHTGYNASNSQDFNCKLFMKTSNGAGTGPRFNSWVENTGKNLASPAFKWINTNASGTPTVGGTSFELYMNVPPYCNGSIYAINKHSGDWTSQNAIGQSDPGADSTTVLQAQNVFNILNTNVGIGTVSPSQKLEVTGNTYVTGYVQASSALIGYKSGYATFGSNSTATGIALSRDFLPSSYPDLIINSSGSVGIGVSAESTSRLHVKYISGNNNCKMTLESNNSGDYFINYSAASNEMSAGFDTSAAQFIIAGGDNLSVPKFALTQSTGDTTIAGTLTQNSDITLKENIKPLESQLEIVSKLNPVSYNKIGFEDNEVGFIAQEVEKLLPELVREDKDGLKSLAYGNMNAILVKAIQELKAEIELLKNK